VTLEQTNMPPRKTAQSPFAGLMYLQSVYVVPERYAAEKREFPFAFSFLKNFDLSLDRAVTFFVGENGSGKSTLLEAIADMCGLQTEGGAMVDLYDQHEERPQLSRILRPRFRHRPRDGWFFRAETLVNFATLLEKRKADPDFIGDPYRYYGGKSLHLRSHGEAFLEVFTQRIHEGLFLVDEPEAALSPQRQLALMYLLNDRAKKGKAQFIIATHSPILLTLPGAKIIDFDDPALPSITLQQTKHYQITRGILERPERYWPDEPE
jgi:predicted ATPase